MLDIKKLLESTGMKVIKVMFIKPPQLPYLIYLESISKQGSDYKNNISDRNITVELYSNKIDEASEKLVEDLLDDNFIEYLKSRIWVDSEKLFQTIYEFSLYEKIGGTQ
jgi:hypothetical protein